MRGSLVVPVMRGGNASVGLVSLCGSALSQPWYGVRCLASQMFALIQQLYTTNYTDQSDFDGQDSGHTFGGDVRAPCRDVMNNSDTAHGNCTHLQNNSPSVSYNPVSSCTLQSGGALECERHASCGSGTRLIVAAAALAPEPRLRQQLGRRPRRVLP